MSESVLINLKHVLSRTLHQVMQPAVDFYQAQRLSTFGQIIDGKIVNRSIIYGIEKSNTPQMTYFLHYSFSLGIPGIDQRTYSGKQRVQKGAYLRFEISDPVRIIYLPNHPQYSQLWEYPIRIDGIAETKKTPPEPKP